MRAVVEARPSVVCPVTPRVPVMTALPVAVRLVVDAFCSEVCPDTVSAVAEAVERLVCPCTVSTPDAVRLVVEALASVVCPVALMVVVKKLTDVSPVVEACVRSEVEAKILEVKVFKNRSVEDPREKEASVDGVMLPATCSLSVGDETPIPMLPFARIEKSEAPDDDATLNGLRLEVLVACTLKAYEEEVALMPEKIPLSRSDEVPSVVDVSHRVAKPT